MSCDGWSSAVAARLRDLCQVRVSGARQLDAITGIRLGRGDRPVRSSTGLTASREVPPLRHILPKVAQVRIHIVDGWSGTCTQRSPEGRFFFWERGRWMHLRMSVLREGRSAGPIFD